MCIRDSTNATAYISTITMVVSTSQTGSTFTIVDGNGLKLVDALPTTTVSTAPNVYNFQASIKMTNGISVTIAGGTAPTINVWVSYWQ